MKKLQKKEIIHLFLCLFDYADNDASFLICRDFRPLSRSSTSHDLQLYLLFRNPELVVATRGPFISDRRIDCFSWKCVF